MVILPSDGRLVFAFLTLFALAVTPGIARSELLASATWSGITSTPTEEVGFAFAVGDFFTNDFELLFEDLTFDAGTREGQVFEASAVNEADFGEVVSLLTNGLEDFSCLKVLKSTGAITTLCDLERFTFNLIETDLAGEDIQRITMEIARLEFASGEVDFEVVFRLNDDASVVEPCNVVLLQPTAGAVLDNGCIDAPNPRIWDFAWESCVGSSAYQLQAQGATSPVPAVDVTLTGLSYQSISGGYVTNSNRLGWTWRVRADVGGVWGPWTERSFDVEPVDTDCLVGTETPNWGSVKARY